MEHSGLDSKSIDGSKLKRIFTEERVSKMTDVSKEIIDNLLNFFL